MLMIELESSLSTEDYLSESLSSSKTTVLANVVSQIQLVKMAAKTTFGKSIRPVFQKALSVCSAKKIYFVLDTYLDKSTRESE